MTDTPKTDTPPEIRPFAATLQEIDRGRVHNELGEKLHELIAAAQQTGRGGALTLTLTVKPEPKMGNMIRVSTVVASKLPKPERAEAMFFVGKDGNPSRQDPAQLDMFEANQRHIAAAKSNEASA